MKNFKKYLARFTLVVVLLIGVYKIIAVSFDNGIYEYPIIGVVYEMTWLPLLICLATLPVLWMVHMLRKEIEIKKGISYMGICILSILGVLFL